MSHFSSAEAIRFLRFHSEIMGMDAASVDGLGDRVAILGVSLWATLPRLVRVARQDKLRFVWLTR